MTDSIGQQLRKARETHHLSLEQASQMTRIKVHYLQALEADNFAALPSTVQQRGFLRSYASLLHLPVESLLAQLDGENQTELSPPGAGQGTRGAAQTQAEVPQAPIDPRSSSTNQAILQDLGDQLRRQREALGLTLEDVEQQTHLRLHYLKALEGGVLEDLPSPVQGRGMLNNYAEFLGLETEPVLLRYADGLQADLKSRQVAQQQTEAQAKNKRRTRQTGVRNILPGPLRRLFFSDFWVGALLVIFLLGFVSWAALRISQMQAVQTPTATAPSVAEILAPDTPTPTASLPVTPAEEVLETGSPDGTGEPTTTLSVAEVEAEAAPTDVPTPDFPDAASGRIQLYVVARQRAWARVIVDGEVELEGRVIPGSAYLFTGDNRIELVTGNGAALQIFMNRQDLGPMGIFGQVVERVFTMEGMQTATPAVPPTATPTPTPTEGTVTVTPTPTSSIP